MSCVLVDDVEAVVKLYKPVGVEHLADQLIFCLDLALQEILFEQVELLWLRRRNGLFCRVRGICLPDRLGWQRLLCRLTGLWL